MEVRVNTDGSVHRMSVAISLLFYLLFIYRLLGSNHYYESVTLKMIGVNRRVSSKRVFWLSSSKKLQRIILVWDFPFASMTSNAMFRSIILYLIMK